MDDGSYLLSVFPVGANKGEPSLLVRMRQANNGGIMRIFQLYVLALLRCSTYTRSHTPFDGPSYGVDDAPFVGNVADVAVCRWNGSPDMVWTSDDSSSR